MAEEEKENGFRRVQVSERALVARINRRLAKEFEQLNRARPTWYGQPYGWGENQDLGRYYVIDLNRNALIRSHVDLEAFGREVGALAQWEELKAELGEVK